MTVTVRVGLTGGIGSGKSTVAQILGAHGAIVIDADAISRNLTASGGDAIATIAAEFGPEFITPSGELDRPRMRELVYADGAAKQRLEAIIHPLVGRATQQQAQDAVDHGKPCIVFDIPLLVEAGHWRSRLDRVLVIDCAVETQVRRVMIRSGLSRAEVEKIIAAQASRTLRLAAADSVIHNEDISLDDLQTEIEQLAGFFGL